MPSDPSGRFPIGVLARSAPDFFDDNMCYGGAQFRDTTAGKDSYFSISLFNNDNSGRALKVYGLTTGNDSADSQTIYPRQGPPLGSFIGNCQPNRLDAGLIAGQIFALQNQGTSPFPNPNPIPAVPMIVGNSGFSGITLVAPFPMFIIPVGWSIVVVNTHDTSTVFAGFWFQVANE